MAWKYNGNRYGNWYEARNFVSQSRPFNKPLPYEFCRADFPDRSSVYSGAQISNMSHPFTTEATHLRFDGLAANNELNLIKNKALDKLYEAMSQASDLMVAWKERQSCIDLITSSIGKLVRVARAVKRRDPNIVRAIKKRKSKGRDIARDPAGLWLQYHFAIVPTILDIHHAAGILGYDLPPVKFSFTSGGKFNSEYVFYDGWDRKQYCTIYNSVYFKIGGEIASVNPNIQLATMLGFGQPLSVIWEMTPFSWFVDYFINVGELVTNLETRFPGVTFKNQYYTLFHKGQGMYMEDYSNPYFTDVYVPGSFVHMKRTLGWPSYSPTFKNPLELKPQQCSYIAAVLVNLLSSFADKKR